MKVHDYVLDYEQPIAENEFAFISKMREMNPLFLDDLNDIYKKSWTFICEIYSYAREQNRLDWLPGDFYFTFYHMNMKFGFQVNLKHTIGMHLIIGRLPSISQRVKKTKLSECECWLTAIEFGDEELLKTKFLLKNKYLVTQNHILKQV